MRRPMREARIGGFLALASLSALAGCDDPKKTFLNDQAELLTAMTELRAELGARPRALRVAVEPYAVTVEAQDPKNPAHVDRWKNVKLVFGSFAKRRLTGPEPVQLQLINPDLEANLFDLDAVDFAASGRLEAAAIARAKLQDPAAVTRMEIARQTYILPKPGSGVVRWSLNVDSGRERAEILADPRGAIVGARLGGTLRAQTLNLLKEPELLTDAAASFRAAVGDGAVLTKVSVDPKTVAFNTNIPDSIFGKGSGGLPASAVYTWDLDGLVRRIGVVNVAMLTREKAAPPFRVDDVDWSIFGKLKADALERAAIPGARVTEAKVDMSSERPGASTLAWTLRLASADDEATTIVADVKGVIQRVELPASRRPKIDWRQPAALSGALAQLAATFGGDVRIASIAANENSARVTLDDPADGGKQASFEFNANGLGRISSAFSLVARDARFLAKDLSGLTEQKITALETAAHAKLGGRKPLYLDSLTIGPHPFAPRIGARAIEIRFRTTPETSSQSDWAWIVYDFDGRVQDFSAP